MGKTHAPTLTVGGETLSREKLRHALAESRFAVAGECAEASEALALDLSALARHGILIVFEQSVTAIELNGLRRANPELRIVALSADPALHRFEAAIAAGVDAYLLDDIAPKSLINSLTLAMAGQKVLPVQLAKQMISKAILGVGDGRQEKAWRDEVDFEILARLARGESNRSIATGLGIRELEVKARMKGLLSRLGVTNRTQAALRAEQNGLVPAPASGGGKPRQTADGISSRRSPSSASPDASGRRSQPEACRYAADTPAHMRPQQDAVFFLQLKYVACGRSPPPLLPLLRVRGVLERTLSSA